MNTHPAAATARAFITGMSAEDFVQWLDALEGVRQLPDDNAQRCYETMCSVNEGIEVSDLDVLGLAWTLRMCLEMGGYPQ